MKWDGPDLLVVRCSSFAARKGKRGKGDELRKGKDSSLFLCSKILTTSFFRQLPSPPWKQQRELRPCIEYDGAARRWLHRGRYRGIVSFLFRAWLRSGYRLLHVYPDTPCNFPPPPRKLSLGSANLEGFRISISTYSYNPLLLLRSWRMNTSPSGYIFVDDDAVLDGVASLFSKGFEFRCFAPFGKYDVFRCIDFVKLECRPRSSWEGQKGFWFLIQGSRIRRYFSLFSFFSPILAYVYILFQLYMNKNLVLWCYHCVILRKLCIYLGKIYFRWFGYLCSIH